MLDRPKLATQFLNAETIFHLANSALFQKKRCLWDFWEFYAKAKIPRLEKLTHCNIWDFTKLV